jgi:hypothetical protein
MLSDEGFVGVLPLVDSNPPEQDAKGEQWLVTPLAEVIGRSLGSMPDPADVIAAVFNIAAPLATLAERGIAHRDVKPGNLFRYMDQWVVGDFGLVELPTDDGITNNRRVLGPQFFIAPEMLNDPATSDGRPADVYSLAKVLWVLLTGQRYPPPGPHRLDEPATSLAQWIEYDRSAELDQLVARSTTYNPAQRISMSVFGEELRATIIRPGADFLVKPDRDSLAKSISARLEPGVRIADKAQAYTQRVNRILKALHDDAVSPAYHAVLNAVPMLNGVSLGSGSRALAMLPPATPMHSQLGASGVIATRGISPPITATFATGLRASEEGTATIVGFIVVADGVTQPPETTIWTETHTDVLVGSSTQTNAIASIAAGMLASIDAVLVAIDERIRSRSE